MKYFLYVTVGILSLVAGCEGTGARYNSYDPVRKMRQNWSELSYDSTIMHASLDGFRIQMSPRMAKQVAKERGYKVDSFFSSITFDDIIEAGYKERRLQETIWLKRYDGKKDCSYEIMLGFDYGKADRVELEHEFRFQKQRAEEMFDSYLKRFPQLTIEKETENFRVYRYKPNERATMTLIFDFSPIFSNGDGISRVSISVSDINYTTNQIYQDVYR